MKELDYQGPLADTDRVADHLAAAGLSPEAAATKAGLLARAVAALADDREQQALFVPGRIEVLGKHTDYAGGRTMVAVPERGFAVVVAPRNDRQISVTDAAVGQTTRFEWDPELVPHSGHWSNYPMTVARRLGRNFPNARRGADIAFASDLPAAAGMSSSSAMMVAVFLALSGVNDLVDEPQYRRNIHDLADLAGYLGTVENGQTFGTLVGDRGVGTFGGSEDHTAMLCGKPNRISQYSYCPVRFERDIAVSADYTFAIGVSGVAAEKTGAAMEKYNAASRRASAVVELWREQTGGDELHLAAVLAGSPEALARLRAIVSTSGHEEFDAASLSSRLEHFLAENDQIIPAAGNALAKEDLDEFGRLVDESQQIAERLLGNQMPQTIHLAASARRLGAAAASAFGAGFGGSVWAMVEKREVDSLLESWAGDYRTEFPRNARLSSFFATSAGPAAFRLR